VKVLLTGHHGYIGSVTASALRAAGHQVVGLDTFCYKGCDLLPDDGRVESLQLDLRDVEAGHLAGFDAVVHLAALSNDPLGDLDPELTTDINFRATLRLAQAAEQGGVSRFVFSSSCSMYGASGTESPVDETAPLQPLTAYAESKVRSEETLGELAREGFSPIFMRNATAYGVSPRMRVDLVLNNLVGWALTTGKVRILSDGTPWRPLVHVQDIARATVALLEAPIEAVHAQAFNIGADSENYQVRDLAEIVRGAVGDCEIEYPGRGDPDPRSYRVDFGKFTGTFPGARPTWTAKAGALEIAEAYRSVGLTLDQFEGDRYIRLKRLKLLLDRDELDPDLRWRATARVR
jgi:nucleoside-diphosphate-sugar epimerase